MSVAPTRSPVANCPVESRPLLPPERSIHPSAARGKWAQFIYPEVLQIGHWLGIKTDAPQPKTKLTQTSLISFSVHCKYTSRKS